MSDHICAGVEKPGPTSYHPYENAQKDFTCSVIMKMPIKKATGYKIQKVNGPDPGSYEGRIEAENRQSTRKTAPSIKFSKKEHTRFTEEAAKQKAFVPGVGNYKTDECYKKLSRPPSASMRRR